MPDVATLSQFCSILLPELCDPISGDPTSSLLGSVDEKRCVTMFAAETKDYVATCSDKAAQQNEAMQFRRIRYVFLRADGSCGSRKMDLQHGIQPLETRRVCDYRNEAPQWG